MRRCTDRRIMTQSITLEELDCGGGGEFAFNMMPPWKHTHDVAFNLMPQAGTQLTHPQPQPMLDKSHHQAGQKRRRPGSSEQSQEHFFHNYNKEAGNDNNTSPSFANGFGIFPFRASPAAAAATASVLFQSNNNAEFRNHHRSSLESAEAATAQAMANFQALIDQSRSSSGFLAYNSSQRQHSIPSFRNQQQQQQQQQQEPPEQQQHSQPIHIFQKESNLVFAKEALQSNQAFSNSHSNHGYAKETLLQGFSNSQANHGYAKESLQSNQGFSNSHSNRGYAKEALQSNQVFSNSQSNVHGYATKEALQSNQVFSNPQSNHGYAKESNQVFSGFEVPTQTTSSAFNFFGDGLFQDSTTPHSSFSRETYSQNSSAYFGNMTPGVHDASISLGLGAPVETPGAFGDRGSAGMINGNYSGFRDLNSSTVSLGLGGPAINGTYRTPTSAMSLDFGHSTTESVTGFHRTTESENGAYHTARSENGAYHTARSENGAYHTTRSENGACHTTRSENGAYHTARSENGAYHTVTESVNGAYHTVTESVNGRSGVATGNFHDTSLELGGSGYGTSSPWPKLNCQTTTTTSERDYPALVEPESPCTPRDDHDTPAVLLSEAQEEYLQHIERLNADFDSPPPQRGRRIPYPNEEAPPAEHNYSIFHPFEAQKQQQQHLHIYFDESGMPQQFEEEEEDELPVAEAAVSETRDLFEDCFPAASIAQEECFEVPAVVVVVSEKESSRSIADQFDLNEVPVITVGEATGTPPSKPRKKYHPRVAKDKRTYKRKVNVDGKKSSHAVDANTNSSPKSKSASKKRGVQGDGQQQPTTQTQLYDEEGRDSSYPEVVDMEIEDMSTIIGVPPPTTTTTTTVTPQQHDTAICDCESCIKLRLESRRTAPKFQLSSSPVSPPDSSSNTQRTLLFEETTPEPAERIESAVTVLAKESSPFEINARSLFGSCLQQFNESTALLGYSNCSTTPSTTITGSFMSRLCTRGILSPQKIAFRDMNPIQRVLYLKSILTSTSMSPESLLRHVHDHLPEGEKQQFESSLWPSILKPLTEDQTKQLEHYANAADTISANPGSVKRKPGPKPKKVKELAMMLWPGVMVKPVKPRKSKKEHGGSAASGDGLQMVPYEKSSSISVVVNESSSNGTGGVMVPYEGGEKGVVVPYEGPFNPLSSRKRKPRAKVVLDHETVRVWKLLMGKTASGTENVTDSAENEMKWEEERRKMKNRALLFIDRMHIVQGDRSFSCWKGSVVDSVVGAFLTQNVNDVLSSSAFMSMRSRFPGRGFRKTSAAASQQQPEEEEETVAQSFFESPSSQTSSIAPPPNCSTITTVVESTTSTTDHPLTVLESTIVSTTVIDTVVESQESRNDSIDTLAKNIQEESSEEVVNQPDGMMNLIVCSHSEENSNSGLEYTSSSDKELVVVASEIHGGVVVEHDPALGKYNPKTGLTGLERAQIEEKQVTARKSFDFSGLQDEFRPRLAGEQRPKAPPRTEMTQDGVDWEAVRAANVQEVADVIKERGLNWILAGRIKAFLERIHLDYGDLDLEWLRSMSTDQTKEFLLSIRGLGLKSVECIRLLTLHHLAFPVDTNVGRICVRLGWVPLEPLPEELQLHLLELYPVQATIQKYLWPRLCKLDQQTLYELHYQMITFGKVFCTKSKPNCNACPMRPECKHFASALSSAKLALSPSQQTNNGPTLALPPGTSSPSPPQPPIPYEPQPRPVSQYCQPIVEEPMTPESEADMEEFDMEDYPFTVEELDPELNPDLNPDINLCLQGRNLRNLDMRITEPVVVPGPVSEPVSEVSIMEDWGGLATSGTGVGLQESCGSIKIVESVCEEVVLGDSNVGENNSASEVLIHPGGGGGGGGGGSDEMVLVAPGSASIPVPKLKNVGRLRTVHYVYELPDNHPLLDGLDPREHDDPCTYLLAIWSPGEVPESIPNMNDTGDEENPFAAASSEGQESIKATLLVPCRTAMRGSFPLNGTYFQVNEVFADHASSLQPMIVPRTLLWNLRRRFVFFGTSVTSIFRGMTVEEIQACFWRGYVCVRGFDRVTRAPKPLVGRLHLQAGKASEKKASNAND